MTVTKISRWKKLYCTQAGREYFMHRGQRWHLDNFMAFDRHNPEWDGSMQLSNTGGMLIKLSNCGEAVKIAFV